MQINKQISTAMLASLLLIIACSTVQISTTVIPSNANATNVIDKLNGLTVLFGSTDLSVGQNRVIFGLLGIDGALVKQDSVDVSFSHLGDSADVAKSEAAAIFREWPYGGGVYTTQAYFSRAGTWRMDVYSDLQPGAEIVSILLDVPLDSKTPALGSRPPSSRNKTILDGYALKELTTDPVPDEGLYRTTIADALDSGKPLVVTFATPAFCRSSTCGPQLDVIKEIKTIYENRVNFIHIEVFDNPIGMKGDISNGHLSPVMIEWGLESEPFTFVIDSFGNVVAKFEGFATVDELNIAIEDILN